MATATFIAYKKGYYTFRFDNGEDIIFEEVHPKVLKQFDLKSDKSLLDKSFQIKFSEQYSDDDSDLAIYSVDHLKLIE